MDVLPLEYVWRRVGAGTLAGHSHSPYRARDSLPFLRQRNAILIQEAFFLDRNIKNF